MPTEVLTTEAELRALAPEWRVLAERASNAFLTPEWFFSWLSVYRDEASPWVPVVRDDDGRLAGLMTLARRPGRRGALHFAGATIGDLFGPVAAEGAENLVAESVAARLRSDREWGLLLLEKTPAEASWPEAFAGGALRTTALRHRDEVSPAITLSGRSWEDYLAERSRNFRSQLGRKLRGLEREGELRFRQTADPSELARDLETFFALHDARWDERGGSGALSKQARDFHRAFAPQALERKWLRLWLLELDGEPITAWYGWRVGGLYSYYLSGWTDRWSRYSTGQLILAHTIEAAFAEGASEYGLLLGGEEYKARFAETYGEVRTVAVTRTASRARAALVAESAARRVADRLSPELREKVTSRLRAVTRRAPSRTESGGKAGSEGEPG